LTFIKNTHHGLLFITAKQQLPRFLSFQSLSQPFLLSPLPFPLLHLSISLSHRFLPSPLFLSILVFFFFISLTKIILFQEATRRMHLLSPSPAEERPTSPYSPAPPSSRTFWAVPPQQPPPPRVHRHSFRSSPPTTTTTCTIRS